MRHAPRRLRRAAPKPLLDVGRAFPNTAADAVFRKRSRLSLLGSARAIRRLLSLLVWTVLAISIQSFCLLLPGRAKVVFAQVYWAMFCRLIGIKTRVVGRPATRRRVIFVANHSSWLDIPVLGGQLEACFISKGEVGTWPLIGLVARLGRTVFISRQRGATRRERDEMRARLAEGDNLILFPEGTTSDGSRVMQFRSAFFALAEGSDSPLIQPISMAYDRLAGLPIGRATRPLFAWYGDMDIASHYWRLARHRGMRATVVLHAPLDPEDFPDRKSLSHAVWRIVADGAATLRQNRPARPIDTVEPQTAPQQQTAYT